VGEGLMDWDSAASFLGVKPRTVKQLWTERRLVGVRVGRLVRFRRSDLEAFVERNSGVRP